MTTRLAALLITFTLFFAPSALAQATYTTGFEPPTFTLGDVDGQDGWGHVSNSPTGGTIEPVPAGSPAGFGVQSLALRTRNVDFFGVANHLHSASIDPPAGENGSTAGGVAVVDPRSHFSASFWFRTPSAPVISTRSDGRFAELNPSSQGSVATDPANRYAQVRLFNSTNDAGGLVRVEIGWYTSATFTVATVAHLNWGEWYRFDYLIHLVDGLDGVEPNDRFTLTIFDSSETQIGTACGSTWEVPWRTGSFGGSATPRAIDGFDFWSVSGPNGNLAGHLDELTMTALDLAQPLAVTITGDANACFGETVELSAMVTSGLPITSYVWRDVSNNLVGTGSTLSAGAGSYTVTVTDTLCETATSSPFVVTEAPELTVTISGASSVGMGETTTLTANVNGGSGTITSYTWRNALSTIVGTDPTLEAGAGTYTVEVNDATCGAATSSPFTVAQAVTPGVPTMTETAMLIMVVMLAIVAVVRL